MRQPNACSRCRPWRRYTSSWRVSACGPTVAATAKPMLRKKRRTRPDPGPPPRGREGHNEARSGARGGDVLGARLRDHRRVMDPHGLVGVGRDFFVVPVLFGARAFG